LLLLLKVEILENFHPKTFAELLPAAMLRQNRGPAFASHEEMTALAFSNVQPRRARKRLAWSLFMPGEYNIYVAGKHKCCTSGGSTRPPFTSRRARV
jgi:hypothetical protein